MRRLLTFVRRPAVLLPILFLVLSSLFGNWLTPEPRFTFPTGVQGQDDRLAGKSQEFKLGHVSDDGQQVIVVDELSLTPASWSGPDPRRQLSWWSTHTGTDVTPTWWRDLTAQEHLPWFGGEQMQGLLSHPSGRDLLRDEATWQGFVQRFLARRALARQDREVPDFLPRSLRFSPDGQLVAYYARNGLPLYDARQGDEGKGVIIEEVKTGKQRAALPGPWDSIAFGQRTAFLEEDGGEEKRQLAFWDLETGALRATRPVPWQSHAIISSHESVDGRHVFVRTMRYMGPSELYWWDMASGTQFGPIVDASANAVINNRILVTQMARSFGYDPTGLLCFWDLDTGQPLGEWETGLCQDGNGLIVGLESSASDRYLAVEHASGYDPLPSALRPDTVPWWRAWLPVGQQAQSSSDTQCQVILLDVIHRRELARLPGFSAKLSPQGRWLATLDHAGVVRVWELPLSQPWLTAMLYAAAVTFACWLVLCLLRRVRRQRSD